MRKLTKGFTLIELMIVVAIIGILSAIAIPNFIKFQARAKQSEVKGNLKSIFTAERSYFQEHDKYSGYFASIGFAPERNNRYFYALNGTCTATEQRGAMDIVVAGNANEVDCIEVDTFKHTNADAVSTGYTNPAPGFSTVGPGDPGAVPGSTFTGCPGTTCAWSAVGVGNIDSDTGYDTWWIASTDAEVTGANCGRDASETAAPAGEPQVDTNDVDCDSI